MPNPQVIYTRAKARTQLASKPKQYQTPWPGRGRVVDVAYPKKRRLGLGESQDSALNHHN